MPLLKITVSRYALIDIQEATDWYNEQAAGLGKRFQTQVKKQINSLKTNATYHAIRYDDVRCCPVTKFPFNIHYTVKQSMVEIFAVIHTSRNPRVWENARKRIG